MISSLPMVATAEICIWESVTAWNLPVTLENRWAKVDASSMEPPEPMQIRIPGNDVKGPEGKQRYCEQCNNECDHLFHVVFHKLTFLASQNFAFAMRKRIQYIFRRDMCVTKNTAHHSNVRAQRVRCRMVQVRRQQAGTSSIAREKRAIEEIYFLAVSVHSMVDRSRTYMG